MGWGCYKHEWDAGSENWDKALGELCDRKLTEKPLTFGRDGQICPACYTELEAALAAMTADRDAQAEAVRVLANELSGWRCGGLVHMGATPGYQSSGGIGVVKLKYFDCSKETNANPIAAAAVKGGGE